MSDSNKRVIKKVIAGTAITTAITLGVALGGVAISKEIKYENTQITYNEKNYNLGDLYILSNENGKEMCYEKVIDNETNITQGISLGNGLMMGTDGTVGIQLAGNQKSGTCVAGVNNETTYGYISLDTNKLVCIKGLESISGYEIQEVTDLISLDTAKENDFKISNDQLNDLVPMNNGKSR